MAENTLFSQADNTEEPLAARMRPRTLDEFIGQEHILGPGRLLRRAIQADLLASIILYGPPGTGKTTLARVIANTTASRFLSLNAVLAGVKDVREAIDQAKESLQLYSRRTILFVDEVHRWNKAQQDALLPWVESGTVILIGATTQNPFFEVNRALVSRSRIFQLKPLSAENMREIARRALSDPLRGYGRFTVDIADAALDHLVQVADGDARGLLGALQLAVETTPDHFPPKADESIHITREIAEESIQKRAVLYDKEGDYHYDTISAFIKSIRGSDPDAALYWMAKMLYSGEDPHFIFRRMLIAASEDVGMADPTALSIVEGAARAFDRVGMPEGSFFLSQAALYLSTAPKSNTTLAFFDAMEAVESEQQAEVPNHLRDASRDAEGFGHGKGYLYPHAFRDHWAAQAYLPQTLQGRMFYQPSHQGYEAGIAAAVERRRELQLDTVLSDPPPEVLSYSPALESRRDQWVARAERELLEGRQQVREIAATHARLARHHTVLLAGRIAGLIAFDAVRATPEGRAVIVIEQETQRQTLLQYAEQLPQLERPLLIAGSFPQAQLPDDPPDYDRIILADALSSDETHQPFLQRASGLLAVRGELLLIQRIPSRAPRLSALPRIHPDDGPPDELVAAELALYGDPTNPLVRWDAQTLAATAQERGLQTEMDRVVTLTSHRLLRRETVEAWFDPSRPMGLGATLDRTAGNAAVDHARDWALRTFGDRDVEWPESWFIGRFRCAGN